MPVDVCRLVIKREGLSAVDRRNVTKSVKLLGFSNLAAGKTLPENQSILKSGAFHFDHRAPPAIKALNVTCGSPNDPTVEGTKASRLV